MGEQLISVDDLPEGRPISKRGNICIIGAGIVGTYCALYLRRLAPDAEITIVDRAPFDYQGASSGNMGGFATCEVQPRTTLANLLRIPLWLLDPLGPLSLRPGYLPKLLPWLWTFTKSAFSPGHYSHVVSSQQELMRLSYQAHKDALETTGLDKLISENGAICLYKKPASRERDWNTRWLLFREQGQPCKRLDRDELKQLLPEINPDISDAVHVPGICFWTDPGLLLKGLHDYLRQHGVEFTVAEVTGVSFENGNVSGISTREGRHFQCEKLIVAAGAWSKPLCLQSGDYVPLDTERGYHTTLRNPGVQVDHLLLFVDDDFVATPMASGLRVGGTVEMAGLDAAPDFRRTDLLAQRIRDYFPAINTGERNNWLGFRPSIPDYLPVIGPSPGHANLYYAFGHGHVGMTQSAITGKLVAQTVQGVTPEIDLAPFSIQRFPRFPC